MNRKPLDAAESPTPTFTIYVPMDNTAGLWDRHDCRHWLLTGQFEPVCHVVPDNVEAAIYGIVQHPPYSDATTVLIVDDGVCGLLRDIARESGRKVYVLDPLTGCILPNLLVAELRARRDQVKIRMRSFKELPEFKLWVTGCEAYTSKGHAYTPWVHLEMARNALHYHKRVTANTHQMVIAGDQQRVDAHDGRCILRAHTVASSHGLAAIERESWDMTAEDGGTEPARSAAYEIIYKAALLRSEIPLMNERLGADLVGLAFGSVASNTKQPVLIKPQAA